MSEKLFHHGGRIGDLIYALYTVKKLGGGEVYLSLYHTPGWNQKMIDSLIPLLEYQEYITKAGTCDVPPRYGGVPITHDLHHAEYDFNPECFPEWTGSPWPGNANIKKRYAVHFGIENDNEAVWLTAPKTKHVDLAFHMPARRSVRSMNSWVRILTRLKHDHDVKIVVLSGPDDIGECAIFHGAGEVIAPPNHLETADYINSASVFLGGASSCNTIAEALKKWRLVELASDCHNVYASGKTGFTINGWPEGDIILAVSNLVAKGGAADENS